MPKKKPRASQAAYDSPLTRRIGRLQRQSVGEQPKVGRLLDRAMTAASRAAERGSPGRITNLERRAIKRATAAVALTTTPKEAQGVRKQLRRRATKG